MSKTITSQPVSRVMSWIIIYLDLLLPTGSSDLPETGGPRLCLLFGLASDGVYMCPVCYQTGGSLLHCPSALTTSLRSLGISLWRYISVALVLGSPPPDVIRHPALWSPDFPHLRSFDTCSRDYSANWQSIF